MEKIIIAIIYLFLIRLYLYTNSYRKKTYDSSHLTDKEFDKEFENIQEYNIEVDIANKDKYWEEDTVTMVRICIIIALVVPIIVYIGEALKH